MFQSKVAHSQTEHFSVGVFFVIYLLLTLTCGFPILYMETILGQYARGGPVISWDVIPLFRGKQYVLVSFVVQWPTVYIRMDL